MKLQLFPVLWGIAYPLTMPYTQINKHVIWIRERGYCESQLTSFILPLIVNACLEFIGLEPLSGNDFSILIRGLVTSHFFLFFKFNNVTASVSVSHSNEDTCT